jgi:hypothetical protein
MAEPTTIKLGVPLDLLLDRECHLENREKDKDIPGGLRIPNENDAVNCNIVVRGRPGTGKSLLAMQMAVKCCRYNPGYFAMYVSLEESWPQVHGKAGSFGWDHDLEPLASLSNLGAFASPAEYGRLLKQILTRPDNCPLKPSTSDKARVTHEHRPAQDVVAKVLVSSLSPRSFMQKQEVGDTVFTARYQELEHLLRGAAWLRNSDADKEALPQLRMVCVDSLNVFGDRLLTREQIHQLFNLFRQHGMIGVFVMEEDEGQLLSPDTRLHADTIEYLSDTVIALHADEDSDYFVRYFEIVKSRYQHQVYGKHPFRIVSWKEAHDKGTATKKDDDPKRETQEGLVLYPSLHYIVYGTEPKGTTQRREKRAFPIGDDGLGILLPTDCHRGDVVLIAGPRGTFKDTLALNFLLSGLLAESERASANGLLIRLHDRPGFIPSRDIRLSRKLHVTPDWFENLRKCETDIPERRAKYSIGAYTYEGAKKDKRRLIELAFKSGNILAEEFLHHIQYVIRQAGGEYPITRIVLAEVGLIGVNYPFLKKSRTAGEIFLTALLHTLRNYQDISLLMTGTTEQFREADDMIDRARTLADAVLTVSRCDVFGNRLIVVEGERLMTGFGKEYASRGIRRDFGEYVPAVVIPCKHEEDESDRFQIDLHRLDGLVGFGTGTILRPGLICRVLDEGRIQKEYNESIETMLAHTFGKRSARPSQRKRKSAGIQIDRYSSRDSAVVFDSLELRGNRPLEQTVVAAIDEFCLAEETIPAGTKGTLARRAFVSLSERIDRYEERKKDFMGTIWKDNISHAYPYYANVMLLAYRIRHDDGSPIRTRWRGKPLNLTLPTNGMLPRGMLRDERQQRLRYNWTMVERFVRSIHDELQKSSPTSPEDCTDRFRLLDWMDVPETWACILLDAVVNAAIRTFRRHPEYRDLVFELLDIPGKTEGYELQQKRDIIHDMDKKRGEILGELLRNGGRLEVVRTELMNCVLALQRLFSADPGLRDKSERRLEELDPRAAAYICWYSQLRNLIRDNPSLADKLDICPLPGGGFRGDWFLGVAQGSVSVALGVDLIETLCREDEEYRRFSLGVGMPVRQKFYTKGEYFGWQHGQHVKLARLQKIHHDALTRESIEGYRQFRAVLQTVCHQVVGKPGEVEPYHDQVQLWKALKRIPAQIRMMLPS